MTEIVTTVRAQARDFRLPAQLRAEIVRQAKEGYPEEVCGLLIGRTVERRVEVHGVAGARNLERERARDRFVMDPEDFLAADRRARAGGGDVVGIWHSHPDHPARPSATDLEAAWPGYSYLIVAVAGGIEVELRSWRLRNREFAEEPIVEEGDHP